MDQAPLSRLGKRPLASPMLVSDRGGVDHHSRVQATLSTAEQRAIAVALGAEEDATFGRVPTLQQNGTEAAIYFACLADHLTAFAGDRIGHANTPLDALSSPSLFVTLKRSDKEYASVVHAGEGQKSVLKALTALTSAFSTPPRTRTDDGALEDVWKTALSADVKSINAEGNETRIEFDQMVRIVVDHCQRLYLAEGAVDDKEWATSHAYTNQFTRGALGRWRDALENHQVRFSRGAESNVNVYPYVAVRPLPLDSDKLVLLAVTPFDPWFVDDRVPEDRRLPEILLAVYDTPSSVRLTGKDLRDLEASLAAHLGRFTYRLMSSRRGDALANSAGEGSTIARYWFGQGVSHFLRETEGGGLEFEDVVQFWRRFIEELLCAKIQGVHTTETFPFDRAYIIRGTPAVALSSSSTSTTVTVIETALQSREADTNFQYLTSPERTRRAVRLEDLNLTQKIVKHVSSLELRADAGSDTIIARDKADASAAIRLSLAELRAKASKVEDTPSKHVLASFLTHVNAMRAGGVAAEDLTDAQRPVRAAFDREGFLYDFHAGVAMAEEAPMLEAIDAAYRKLFAKTIDAGATGEVSQGQTKGDAKFVLFCFEPTLAEGNRRTDTHGEHRERSEYYLGSEHAVTVILVADVDNEKGIQEITSEKGDLQVLIQMILQQRIRDRRREASTIDSRVSLIEGVLGSFMHKFANLIATGNQETDRARKAELTDLSDGLQRIIRFDQDSLTPVRTPGGGTGPLSKLIWYGHEAQGEKGAQYDLKTDLLKFINDIAANEQTARGEPVVLPEVDISFGSAPGLTARVPLEAVKECMEVVLSNAVQACVGARAPKPARLRLAVQAYALPGTTQWVWEMVIENTTAPIPQGVWDKLTSEKPEAQDSINAEKSRSTGIGVFMARQLLRSAFGRRSDIRYFRLQETLLRTTLQLPVDAISVSSRTSDKTAAAAVETVSSVASATTAMPIFYIEDNVELAARTKAYLTLKAPKVGITHALSRSEVEKLAKAMPAPAPKLIISDLSIPNQPDDAAQKLHGPKALEALLAGGARCPIWIFTGGDWKDASKVLNQHTRPEKFGYVIAPADDALGHLNRDGVITILPGVKTIEDGEANAPFEQALADIFKDAQPVTSAAKGETPMFATTNLNDDASLNWQLTALANGNVLIVDAAGAPLAEALHAWARHQGFPEIDLHHSSEPSLYPLWDSTVHHWIALRTPQAKPLSLAARYWCLRHNMAPSDLSIEDCARYWAALVSEASGPLGLVRHEIANMRGAAMSENPLFQTVRQRVTALEELMNLSPADEAQLDDILEARATDRLAERLREVRAQKSGDSVRLYEQLEQALIDLLKRTEETSPGEVRSLERLMASVRAMNALIGISGARS